MCPNRTPLNPGRVPLGHFVSRFWDSNPKKVRVYEVYEGGFMKFVRVYEVCGGL